MTRIAVPLTTNKLNTPSPPAFVSSRYLSNSGSHAFPSSASHTTSQSRKWPAAVLRRMLSPVELTALSGRTSRMEPCADCGGATILPRLPMTVGVPVMLLMLWSSEGRGRAVRVQWWVVLRQ